MRTQSTHSWNDPTCKSGFVFGGHSAADHRVLAGSDLSPPAAEPLQSEECAHGGCNMRRTDGPSIFGGSMNPIFAPVYVHGVTCLNVLWRWV